MERVEVEGYPVDLISPADMAGYIERALNDDKVINACSGESEFETLGHLLQAYAVATGDLSAESVERIADNFAKNKDKINLPFESSTRFEGIQRYFADHMTEDIIAYHAQKLKIPTEEIIKNKRKILSSIYLQSHNNQFMTHSFSGKLADKVKAEGLNIGNELFQKEYKALELAGMRQAYKKGVLCFCELSKATFGYAQGCPERLTQAIGIYRIDSYTVAEDETYKEILEKNLRTKVERNTELTPQEKQIVNYAGQKIIDFYCIEPKSAIAFMRTDELRGGERKLTTECPDWIFKYESAFTANKTSVETFLQNKGDEELQKKYGEAVAELAEGKKFGAKQAEFVDEFNQRYPDKKYFKDFYKNADTAAITSHCLICFVRNGNADGYTTDKIEPHKMSIAVFDAPHDLYALRLKEIKRTEEKLIAEAYQKSLYEKKHMVELKRGAKPAESFEQFREKNPHDPKSVGFISFRITEGYNRTDSENYKKVHEQAKKMVVPSQKQNTTSGYTKSSSGYTM